MRYAGIRSGFRLLAAGIRDMIRSKLKRAPVSLPIFGPPGSLAFLSSPDCEPGYAAIVPAGWRNETPARIALKVALYRPGRRLYDLTCPLLIQPCLRDVIAPPPAIDLTRQRRGRRNITVITYDCGHFDLYQGEWFEKSVTDQIAFLKMVIS